MGRLKDRIAFARKALDNFRKLAGRKRLTDEQRDAAIKRFEYSFETVWKAAQAYLQAVEGDGANSPKSCIRASRENGLLSEGEAKVALAMADARNLAAHTYNEKMARRLTAKLGTYAVLLDKWLGAITGRSNPRMYLI